MLIPERIVIYIIFVIYEAHFWGFIIRIPTVLSPHYQLHVQVNKWVIFQTVKQTEACKI